MDTPGQTVRRLRNAKGLSQEKLARVVGVTMGAVAQWERGDYVPRHEHVEKLDDALEAGGEILASFGYAIDGRPLADLWADISQLRGLVERLALAVAQLQETTPIAPRRRRGVLEPPAKRGAQRSATGEHSRPQSRRAAD